jgi:C4-dicarboxylate-specific signal transduction histidine kinase
MTNDRTYLRMCDDGRLIDLAHASGDDLALVLAERLAELADVEAQLEHVTNERDELDARCDIWQQAAIEAQDELAAIDAMADAK